MGAMPTRQDADRFRAPVQERDVPRAASTSTEALTGSAMLPHLGQVPRLHDVLAKCRRMLDGLDRIDVLNTLCRGGEVFTSDGPTGIRMSSPTQTIFQRSILPVIGFGNPGTPKRFQEIHCCRLTHLHSGQSLACPPLHVGATFCHSSSAWSSGRRPTKQRDSSTSLRSSDRLKACFVGVMNRSSPVSPLGALSGPLKNLDGGNVSCRAALLRRDAESRRRLNATLS